MCYFIFQTIYTSKLNSFLFCINYLCFHQSSGSESESRIHARKTAKARSIEVSDDDSDSSDEDDDRSIGRAAKDGSDNGSGTQVLLIFFCMDIIHAG